MSGPSPLPLPRALDVSVIVPCYRCAATIERAVRSVLDQTLPAREILLVDDASPDDDTPRMLDALAGRHGAVDVRTLRLARNGGAGAARNAGWEAARGELLAYLDADDSWHRQKLERQVRIFRDDPSIALASHTAARVDGVAPGERFDGPVWAVPIGARFQSDGRAPRELPMDVDFGARIVARERDRRVPATVGAGGLTADATAISALASVPFEPSLEHQHVP